MVAKSNHQDMSKVVKLNCLDIVALAVESNCPDFEALVARLKHLHIAAAVAKLNHLDIATLEIYLDCPNIVALVAKLKLDAALVAKSNPLDVAMVVKSNH